MPFAQLLFETPRFTECLYICDFLCFVNYISTYMLEGKVLEERDTDLEEEEDIGI